MAYDVSDDWTFQVEVGGGAKLEPIPYYGAPGPSTAATRARQLPTWEPYPGPRPMESGFVLHGHLGAVFKKQLILGAHFIDVFSNDNERSTAFTERRSTPCRTATSQVCGRASDDPLGKPRIMVYGADAKLLGGVLGDGYIGYARLDARNAIYLPDAIETIHSFGGWQLHDNYFGAPGAHRPGARQDRHRAVPVRVQLRPAVLSPGAVLGAGPRPDRVGVRYVQPRRPRR